MLDPAKIKARDLMQTDVVQLHADTPIKSAIETLEEYSISGAPVVDETGKLVGVLSDSDIVKTEHLSNEEVEIKRTEYYFADPLEELDEPYFSTEEYDPEVLGQETVGEWMTPHVISVEPEVSLSDVCTVMAEERIHRVFVVKDSKLLGVISTFDIVKCLANPARIRS